MNQKQQRGPGGSGSSDIETGKPQDPRENRHPGESNLSQNPQQAQQHPQGQRGQHDEKQQGDNKGGSQQHGNDKAQQNKGGQQNQQNTGRKQEQGHGSGQQGQQGASTGDKQYGEGNYKASKDYNDRTKQFVESGRVDQAAKDAAPKNEKESREMKDAEREGRRPMREEDPEINPDTQKKPGHGPDARR